MTDYSKQTNFTAKDALPSGDPNKRINGSLFDAEYDDISTAIASKVNKVAGETGELAQFKADGDIESAGVTVAAIWPVGSIYINAGVSTNPATLLGFGTWVAFGTGRTMVGLDSGDTAFDTLEETGGSSDAVVVSHSHGTTESNHTHTYADRNTSQGVGGGSGTGTRDTSTTRTTGAAKTNLTINNEGVSGVGANLQPYIVVYMWKRTG